MTELVLDYLVTDMQNVHVPDPVVFLIIVLVPDHADLRLIPTIARTYRDARRINRFRGGARRTRGACAGGLLACPESVPVFFVGVLCRHVNLNRLRAIRGDVTKGDLLLTPTVACRGGGIARGGARGIRRTRGAGASSIRRSRSRTCSGARRIRSARAGGTRSACGGARGIGRTSRTCGAGRIRGGICRTGSAGGAACGGAGGIGRASCARASCGAGSSRGACAGGARCGGCSGVRRTRGARGGGIIAWPEFVPVIFVGLLCWCANRYRVLAFVAEGDLILAFATSLWFREGHGYHKQHA